MGPNPIFFSAKNSNQKMPKKYFRVFGPKIGGVQKLPKTSFFGLKISKNFESDIQFVFSHFFSFHHEAEKELLH